MDSLFGIPMNDIMVVLLVLLGISLSTVAYVALRNRVMFVVGIRNIPRRVAQTALIIIGLMLSTTIISAAFTVGDTVDHSITKMVYDTSGHVDETVQVGEALFNEGQGGSAVVSREAVPESLAADLEARFQGDSEIEGFLPVILEPVAAAHPLTRQSAPLAVLAGVDASRLSAFPDIVGRNGNPVDVAALALDEVLVNESLADEIDAEPGDAIDIYYQNQRIPLRVVDIVKDCLLTGSSGYPKLGMATRLDTLQGLFNRPGEADFIAVANRGGVHGGLQVADSVKAKLEDYLKGKPYSVDPLKAEGVESAEEAGNILMTFFLVLGLFSIAAGILLTVMIFVMLAAERKTEMGISRAVGMKRRHLIQSFMSEGMGYNMLSALVGVTLGVLVAIAMAGIMMMIIGQFISIESKVTLRSLVMSYSLGVSLTFLTVVFSSWRVSNLNIVRAIRDLPEPEARPRRRSLFVGIGLAVFGALLMLTAIGSKQAAVWGLGISLLLIGVAVAARYLGAPERPLFTASGLFILVYWTLGAGDRIPGPEMTGGVELFFLSGIMMVAAATFVVMYNAHLLLGLLALGGRRMGRIFPAIKTAIAYPLATKFRSGMTMAMIALVIFALTMMSVMNGNFDRAFLADEARGGWDVRVQENPSNPIGDLREALATAPAVDTSKIEAVGKVEMAGGFQARLKQDLTADMEVGDLPSYIVAGLDEEFLKDNRIELQSLATGYESDRAVWDALANDPSLAVIDSFAAGGSGYSFGEMQFTLEGVDPGESTFDAVPLEIIDPISDDSATVKVIGIMAIGPSYSFYGLYTGDETIRKVFGEPDYNVYYVRLAPGEDAKATAKAIEASLFMQGAQAVSIKEEMDDQMELSRGFFYLMQGFMGLGLVVGIAAVGVIAFRTVVERRQQIGMLRAIGYSRGQVALSFLLESSFITILGILTGLALAIALSYFLLTSESMSNMGLKGFYVPWIEVIPTALFAYIAALVMTFVPARQAASIPIAEALRYE